MNQRPDQDRYYEPRPLGFTAHRTEDFLHENEYEGDDCERVNPIKYGLGRRGIDGVEEVVERQNESYDEHEASF